MWVIKELRHTSPQDSSSFPVIEFLEMAKFQNSKAEILFSFFFK